MRTQLTQSQGGTLRTATLMAIARSSNCKISEVAYFDSGLVIDNLKYLYDKDSESIWVNTGTGKIVSWTLSDETMTVVTNTGTYVLNKEVDGSTGSIKWVYNGGYAKGGETSVTVDADSALSVTEVYLNGGRQFEGQGYTASGLTVTLASPLVKNDLLVVILGSETLDSTDALQSILTGSGGANTIGTSNGSTVQNEINKSIKIEGYYSSGPLTISSENSAIIYQNNLYRFNGSVSLPLILSGNDDSSWNTDKNYFYPAFSNDVDVVPSPTNDLRGKETIRFGRDNKGLLQIDPAGIISTSFEIGGVPSAYGMTIPYVVNTGQFINTALGNFQSKQIYFPSNGFEDRFQSPSIGITYGSDGTPSVAVITPTATLGGSASWPNQKRESKTFWNLALNSVVAATYKKLPPYLGKNSSTTYIQIAKWTVSTVPWNTEYKVAVTSSNTGDNFVGTLTLEANVQSSGTSFATVANVTQGNLSKYFKVRFDGPSDRVPYASATSSSIPMFGCYSDGTYLYLYLVVPAGNSSTKINELHIGVGSSLVTDYTASTTLTTAPTGFTLIPIWRDLNGQNTAMANDGVILSSDNHVRICPSSGSYSARPDIEKDGFLWGGYGTYKNNRQTCTITHTGTGVYTVTGPRFNSNNWLLHQPKDTNGTESAIAQIASISSDGLTATINVYAVKYTYDSTAGTVTRGIGAAIDIPTGSWVDLHAAVTY